VSQLTNASMLEERFWEYFKYKGLAPQPGYIDIDTQWRELLPKTVGAAGRLLINELSSATTVLDVGAGDRYYADVLKKLGLSAKYSSVDLDTTYGSHDYREFLQVQDKFDAILMFELIEHLSLNDGIEFMAHARQLLRPNCPLIISTPNAHHPNQVWRSELTHIRPWPANSLYAILRLVGFDSVKLVRQYFLSGRKRRLIAPLTKALYRILELDHAQTTIAIARWSPHAA